MGESVRRDQSNIYAHKHKSRTTFVANRVQRRMRGRKRKSRHPQSYHTAGLVRVPKIGHLCCAVIRLLSRQMAWFFLAQKLSLERAAWSVIEQASERALLTTNDHFIIVYCSALTLVREKITTRKEVSRRSAHSLSSTSLSQLTTALRKSVGVYLRSDGRETRVSEGNAEKFSV